MLKLLLEERNMSLYALEKKSHVPHATLCDIYQEKCDINKCSILTMKKIADALKMSIDKLYDVLTYKDLSYFTFNREFDLYKSHICQELKSTDDISFLKKYLTNNEIMMFYEQEKYTESLYLLAMVDYLCDKNHLPLVKQYDVVRAMKSKKVIVPESIYLLFLTKNVKLYDLYKEAIPSFLNHNILEAEISNVA